jgi:hypothetical protein
MGLWEGNTSSTYGWNTMNTSQDGCSSTTISRYFRRYPKKDYNKTGKFYLTMTKVKRKNLVMI